MRLYVVSVGMYGVKSAPIDDDIILTRLLELCCAVFAHVFFGLDTYFHTRKENSGQEKRQQSIWS